MPASSSAGEGRTTESYFLAATPSRTILAAVQSSTTDPSAPPSHYFHLYASLSSHHGCPPSTSAQWASANALAKTYDDGDVHLVSLDSPKEQPRSIIDTGIKGGAAVSCDGKGQVIVADARSLTVMEADGTMQEHALKGHISAPSRVSQSNDGLMIAVHSTMPSTSTLVFPSTSTSHVLAYRPARPLTSLHFSPTRRTLLAGGTSKGYVHIWDTTKPSAPRHTFADLHDGAVAALAFAPQPKAQLMLSAGLDGNVKVIDLDKLEVKTTLRFGMPITTLAWSHNMTTVLIGTSTGKVIHQDLRMAASRKPLTLEISRESIHSLAFAPPGSDLASLDLPTMGAHSSSVAPVIKGSEVKGRAPLGVVSVNGVGLSSSSAADSKLKAASAPVAAGRLSFAPSVVSSTSSRKRAEPDFTRRPSPVMEKAPLPESSSQSGNGVEPSSIKTGATGQLGRRMPAVASSTGAASTNGKRMVSAPLPASRAYMSSIRGSAEEAGKLAKGRGAQLADASLMASEGDGSVLGVTSFGGDYDGGASGTAELAAHGTTSSACPHCGGSSSASSAMAARANLASQHALATKDDLAELGSTIEGRLKELAMENLRSQRRARRELEAMLRRLLLGGGEGEGGEKGEMEFGASVGTGLDLAGSVRGGAMLGNSSRGGVVDELKRLREENEALRAQLGANRAWRGF